MLTYILYIYCEHRLLLDCFRASDKDQSVMQLHGLEASVGPAGFGYASCGFGYAFEAGVAARGSA